MAKQGLLERLAAGPVICAEGYLFELERRGYLQAGAYVPEVVLDFPDQVENLHRDFLRAGTDVIEAFTYYAHREKLQAHRPGKRSRADAPGRLAIAKKVAAEGDALVAGNIWNTNIFAPDDTSRAAGPRDVRRTGRLGGRGRRRSSYRRDVFLARRSPAGARGDQAGQAALRRDPRAAQGIRDARRLQPGEAAKRIADQGAAVVGLNCIRGPAR